MFLIKTRILRLLLATLGVVLLAVSAEAQSLTPPPLTPPETQPASPGTVPGQSPPAALAPPAPAMPLQAPLTPAQPQRPLDLIVTITLATGKSETFAREIDRLEVITRSGGAVEMIHLLLVTGGERNTHVWYNSLKPEFEKRNCKVIGLSIDSVDNHEAWSKDIEETQGHAVNYPIIGDTDLEVAKLFDMIHPNATGKAKERTAADNATIRSVFVIGPDKTVKLMLTYPMSTGRNFDEVLRVLDSMQLTARHKVATPVNWKQGEDVIIVPAVSDEEAKEKFPGGWKAPKPYLRLVPQPK